MAGSQRCSVHSATILGVKAYPVTVEVIVTQGMPGFAIVGMPDAAINESRERVRAAIRACGFAMPKDKVVVNLAPGFLRKTGSGFDLPIALGLLAATKQINPAYFENALVVGELALDGSIRPVKGLLAHQSCASSQQLNLVCSDGVDIPIIDGCNVFCASSLSAFRQGNFKSAPAWTDPHLAFPDFGDVGGHAVAKRALTIAAAGNHGVLMIGPPGSGKTMLASRLPSIMPSLNQAQRLESAQIHSIAGEDTDYILAGQPPFRAPHHSATQAGLCGGGNPVQPGEVTLAHNGVLFLDELAEFSAHVLQSIRQPLEDGHITITRADGKVDMPSEFMLVAATNPCPCGYLGDPRHTCTCTSNRIATYQGRIGGPLIDRIDICLDVWPSDFSEVIEGGGEQDSQELRSIVIRAKQFAEERESKKSITTTKRFGRDLVNSCRMTARTRSYFESMAEACGLSGRGIIRTLSVARTIADIEQSVSVEKAHVAEALNLRVQSSIGGNK